ncbi:MAG: 5-(carboxyamino)imidazole ribonucleotide mutase [Bacteroidales bacterium]|nr:5-(carboxyamino)imidazole ribonucleotide mutase [Bacteroidales bacterium]MDD6583234.1 5-(carboxyamino)imidazole ribonucleotide mutase [Bacteroidales bacterium]
MKIGVIMGSTSDLEVMQAAFDTLTEFGVEFEKRVISAHRAPHLLCQWAESAADRGIGAIIAGAGGAAHLAGVTAAYTTLPVIGVPIYSKSFGGMDALLATVQMPSGIPVATVAVNGAKNAAILAIEILALQDADLRQKLKEFRQKQTSKIENTVI